MYYFFFSYSRNDNTEYLQAFHKDLDRAVGDLVGENEVSFLDQSNNEPGDVWEAKLERALAASRVFVAVATASYCKKEYCDKEWSAFQDRVRDYHRGQGLAEFPPLAIPILWVPPVERITSFSPEIMSRHFHVGDPASIANKDGILYLTKLKGLYAKEYQDLIGALAERIVSLAHDHVDFDGYANVTPLSQVVLTLSTHSARPVAGGKQQRASSGGTKHVHFVFGAATPAEIRGCGRQSVDAYGEKGGEEWQPFFPDEQHIGAIAPQVAASAEINMIPHILPFSRQLDTKIREYEKAKQLVVVLLDSWTVQLKEYRDTLTKLDEQNYDNCSVVIPWNKHDAETTAIGERLMTMLRSTLHHRFKGTSERDAFLRHEVRSLVSLRENIADVLVRLRAEIIKRTEPDIENLPAARARPMISGPGRTDE